MARLIVSVLHMKGALMNTVIFLKVTSVYQYLSTFDFDNSSKTSGLFTACPK